MQRIREWMAAHPDEAANVWATNRSYIFFRITGLTNESEAVGAQGVPKVLRVVSSSPGELEPVFQAMLENATRICGAKFGVMFYYQDATLRPAADVLHLRQCGQLLN